MPRIRSSLLTGAVCLAALLASAAQTFQPKAVHFKGADSYSDQELITAAGIQVGVPLSSADVNARMQQLMATGLFDGISFRMSGTDLNFELQPSTRLYAMRLENFPLPADSGLDAQIRQRVALYRGRVPDEGGVLNDVRAALEEILKAQGIPATIQVAPYSAPGQASVGSMSFTVVAPRVLIGEIAPEGGGLDPDAEKVLSRITGAGYDCQGSPAAIRQDVEEVYRSKGFLDIHVQSSQSPTLSIGPDAVRVPFRVSAVPGPLFKVARIELAPDMLVSQSDFDKQSHTRPGDAANAEHIAENWHFIERQYHNHGYVRAQVKPVPTLDHSAATVSYAVSAVPGPVFVMGKLTVENVSEELRGAILKAWKMPEGAVFNEGAILGFFATHSVNPELERVMAAVNIKYVLRINDATRTVDTTIRLERKS